MISTDILPAPPGHAPITESQMGLLSEGKPLSWPETKKKAGVVQRVGVKQFLALYHRLKDRKGDLLKWGDEVRPLHTSGCVESF